MSNLDSVKNVTLLEVLDRLVDKGVVISGDLVISVADVDLLYLGLKLILTSVEKLDSCTIARSGVNRCEG